MRIDNNKITDLKDFSSDTNVSSNYIKNKDGVDMNLDPSPLHRTITDKIIVKDQNPTLINQHTNWNNVNPLLE